MSEASSQFVNIQSEETAWEVLEALLGDDKLSLDIQFDGWPFVFLKIEGERYAATLPSSLMRHVSQVQNALNRCYAQAAYHKDARSIRAAERDDIELVFKVSKGSTELKADATGLLNSLGDAMKKPSTANTTAITLVALALIAAGSVVTSTLSSERRAVEVTRLQTLAKAIDKAPDLKDASPEFQRIYRDIVASASDADRITIGIETLRADDIAAVAKTQRISGERIDLDGTYRVDAVRRFSRHCLVDVILPDGEKIRARIVFDRFPEASVTAVLMAVARNTPVSLSLTAMKHKDGYSSARITSISPIE